MKINKEKNNIKNIRKTVIEEIKEKNDEKLLYIIPYKEFFLTSPENKEELAVKLENVYLVAKEKIINQYGETKRLFELYNTDKKIAWQDIETDKIICDKEITQEVLKQMQELKKQNQKDGTNYKLASVNEKGDIESYFEMINKKLLVLNAKQKKELENSKQKGKKATQTRKLQIENKNLNNNENKEEMKDCIADDLGLNPGDIHKISAIKDDIFYDNNKSVARNYAFAVQDSNGKVWIVSDNGKGKFEKAHGFGEQTKEGGRTSVVTNDTNNIKETNTYGALYSTKYPDMRYTISYDSYGDINLLEERKITQNESGKTINSNDNWGLARKVELSNMNSYEKNREGISSENVTRETFNRNKNNLRTNQELAKVVNSKGENRNMEDIADDPMIRLESALTKIREELKSKGVDLTNEEEHNIEQEVEAKIKNNEVFSQEKVEEYCNNYVNEKEHEDSRKK